MTDMAIKVEKVHKEIGGQKILDNITFEVPQGRIYGLIGRNGSGKTMLLRILCGLVRPTAGSVQVLREDIAQTGEMPKQIGAIIESPGFLPQYSGLKNLKLLASIRREIDDKQIADTMRLVGLDPENKKTVRTYSLGMRQRLGIAQAIMERPRLLLLDEPTNGLDTEGVADLHRLLLQQREEGVAIVLASHNMEEISMLCDRVYRMERGQLREVEQ